MEAIPTGGTEVIAPPPELKIRTMASDMKSLGAGGGFARDPGVVIPNNNTSASSEQSLPQGGKKKIWAIAFLIVVFLVVVVLVGYFAIYSPLVGNGVSVNGGFVRQTGSALQTITPISTEEEGAFSHASLFRIPADHVFVVSAIEGLEKGVAAGLRESPRSAKVLEYTYIDSDGRPFSLSALLKEDGVSLFEEDFLKNHFVPDVTAFIYRDARGVFPGYAMRLKDNESRLMIQKEMGSRIENAPEILALFSKTPGDAKGEFRDTHIQGKPVRSLNFSSGAQFGYAWFNDRIFVIATSYDAMAAAFEHLGR